jgi:hypothetical protein
MEKNDESHIGVDTGNADFFEMEMGIDTLRRPSLRVHKFSSTSYTIFHRLFTSPTANSHQPVCDGRGIGISGLG